MFRLFKLLALLFLFSCSNKEVLIEKLEGFQNEKYLGKWYEIARIDNRFEKNLISVTAEYSLNNDGSIKVINSGFNKIKKERESIEGKAKIIDSGLLKVYFFPFIGGIYNVLYVDENYEYAIVGGGNKDYLWILSRKMELEESKYNFLLEIAKNRGYNISKMIRIKK